MVAAPITCFSSDKMQELLAWREGSRTRGEGVFRVIVTEGGVVCLTLVALVETVAYAVLSGIESLLGESATARLIAHPKQHLSSSALTICWALATALFINTLGDGCIITESHARVRFNMFILELLRNTNLNTKEAFLAVDHKLFPFIFTKAVFEYTLGSRRDQPIPCFFQFETKQAIKKLRIDEEYRGDEQQLRQFFCAEIQDGTALDAALDEKDLNVAIDDDGDLEIGERAQRGSLAACQQSYKKLLIATGEEIRDGELLSYAWHDALSVIKKAEKA